MRRHGVFVHHVASAAAPIRHIVPAPMEPAEPVQTPMARRSVCVRSCDGYFFPVANVKGAGDVGSHLATCAKLCPDAETALYVIPAGSDKIEDAVSARGGHAYTDLTARVASTEKPKSCSCRSTAENPVETKTFMNDFTLRPGDGVVTPQGLRIVRGGSHYPFHQSDFLSLAETRNVPRETRGALAAIERAMNTPRGRAALNEKPHDGHHHAKELRSDLSLDNR